MKALFGLTAVTIAALCMSAAASPALSQAPVGQPSLQKAIQLDRQPEIIRHNFTPIPGTPRKVQPFKRIAFYTDANGVVWSNICQTSVNWCANGQFFPVGTTCHCGYDVGIMAAE